MTTAATEFPIQKHAPIPTWFGVGGGADAFATPRTEAELLACLDLDPDCRILGDGANLLVDDGGVGGLVVSLTEGTFTGVETVREPEGAVVLRVGAGVNLPRLVLDTVRQGLRGLETLGGIPASVGGALAMNAGGAFGEIGDTVARVFAIDRAGKRRTIDRADLPFGYRHSGLQGLLITGCEVELYPDDPAALRARLKEIMAFKKRSQPLAERSAGCCFRNPVLTEATEDLGFAGERIGAGLVIDRAGCKGARVGGAVVSEHHANFVTVEPGATAADVIALLEQVRQRVKDRFGIELEREVVVWSRDDR
jgi:UDP-N-acetylmuramate dehydrogenase